MIDPGHMNNALMPSDSSKYQKHLIGDRQLAFIRRRTSNELDADAGVLHVYAKCHAAKYSDATEY